MLEQALKARRAAHARDQQALGAFRDEKAAPLFVYILSTSEYKGARSTYTQTIESLGKAGLDDGR